MKSAAEIRTNMNHATGTSAHHKYTIMPRFPVITDGVKCLAEDAECFWLLDAIGSHQGNRRLDREFQVWELAVDLDESTAVLKGFNIENTKTPVVTQEIPYTDFPLESVRLYLRDGIILLPSEN